MLLLEITRLTPTYASCMHSGPSTADLRIQSSIPDSWDENEQDWSPGSLSTAWEA